MVHPTHPTVKQIQQKYERSVPKLNKIAHFLVHLVANFTFWVFANLKNFKFEQ